MSATELDAFVRDNPDVFPPDGGYGDGMKIAKPSQIAPLLERLRDAGYPERDVRAIAGENFLRVARVVWPGAGEPAGAERNSS